MLLNDIVIQEMGAEESFFCGLMSTRGNYPRDSFDQPAHVPDVPKENIAESQESNMVSSSDELSKSLGNLDNNKEDVVFTSFPHLAEGPHDACKEQTLLIKTRHLGWHLRRVFLLLKPHKHARHVDFKHAGEKEHVLGIFDEHNLEQIFMALTDSDEMQSWITAINAVIEGNRAVARREGHKIHKVSVLPARVRKLDDQSLLSSNLEKQWVDKLITIRDDSKSLSYCDPEVKKYVEDIPLAGKVVRHIDPVFEEGRRNVFGIFDDKNGLHIVLEAPDTFEMKQWMQVINTAAAKCKAHSINSKSQ